jgi:hypothetical protein
MNYTQLITDAQEHQKGKVCTKCNKHQLLSEFSKTKNSKDGLQWECKSCAKEYKDNMCPFKKWFSDHKKNAKRRGVKYSIKPEDIPGVKIEWYNTRKQGSRDTWRGIKYPKVCPVLGIKLDWGMNGLNNNSPSLDRINNNKGYIPGNIIIMSSLANKMKSNATLEQLNQFSRYHLFGDNNG